MKFYWRFWIGYFKFFLLHPHENQSKLLGYQGWVEILMITLVYSKRVIVRNNLLHSVHAQCTWHTTYTIKGKSLPPELQFNWNAIPNLIINRNHEFKIKRLQKCILLQTMEFQVSLKMEWWHGLKNDKFWNSTFR